jgi:hypothetical protein
MMPLATVAVIVSSIDLTSEHGTEGTKQGNGQRKEGVSRRGSSSMSKTVLQGVDSSSRGGWPWYSAIFPALASLFCLSLSIALEVGKGAWPATIHRRPRTPLFEGSKIQGTSWQLLDGTF